MASHEKVAVAEKIAQNYINRVLIWMDENNLLLADKTQATLFSPDPAEQDHQLNTYIRNEQVKTTKIRTYWDLHST